MNRTNIKRAGMAAIALAVLVGLGWLVHSRAARPANLQGKMNVTASFYPMAEFARQVGGTHVLVTTLVKPGIEPHDYEPTPQDVAVMYNSKVLIYNGAGLETWTGKLLGDLTRHGVRTVEVSQGLDLKTKDPSDAENNSPTDPHVWMDPVLAIHEVMAIRDALSQTDPSHKNAYQAGAAAYITQLQALDAAFHSGLARCQLHDIVTSHQAFGYLASEYGLHAVGIAGLSPDDEPPPQKLAEVAKFVKATGVQYIFFESLVSPKLSDTIASETGAQTISFNPLEGLTNDQLRQGKNYLSVQKDNLQALRTALHCK